ncbi:heparinase II/III domain-containing protein [Desulfurivibrio alkaliphilus]|uniref:Uncharacterized protein n=1 Tax=Desulfurivibrio alkaliphilus (strain DSM 19089 / UNIQEM U267 / AHT2) TaxID=589865 RepID=D6Z4P8_DESAT|nr:heparinase II/III family protein [Desulfurivibrio alkaliphilus]ADH86523.1 hypothetical protein DaAHT2_1842 [Desulfurivibrio alkaliphilus AHT 2]
MNTPFFVQSASNANVYLRAPELEVVAKPALWQEYRVHSKVFVRGNFPLTLLQVPFQWDMDPASDPTWKLYFHSLYFLGTVYHGLTTEDHAPEFFQAQVDRLREMVLSYFDFLEQPQTADSPDVWDDHAASYRSSYLSLVYASFLEPLLDAVERDRYLRVMQMHAEKIIAFMDSGKWLLSNHTIFQIEGLLDIALNFFRETLIGESYINKARRTFLEHVDASVTLKDGTSKEHACFYHVFWMERVRNHYDFLNANGIEIDMDMVGLLKKMNRFLWLVMPRKGLVPPIGDTKYNMFVNEKYYRAFMEDPYLDDETAFLIGQSQERGNLQYLTDFRRDGYFVFRDLDENDTGLLSIFLAKDKVGPHGHIDGGSFVTFLGGTPFFTDSGGPFKYRNPLRYHYFQTQLAHNTLIFSHPCKYQNTVGQILQGPGFGIVVTELSDLRKK